MLACFAIAFGTGEYLFAQELLPLPMSDTSATIYASEGRVGFNTASESQSGIMIGLPTAVSNDQGELLVVPNTSVLPYETSPNSDGEFESRQAAVFSLKGQQPLIMSAEEYSNPDLGADLATSVVEPGVVKTHSRFTSSSHTPIFHNLIQHRQPVRRKLESLFGRTNAPGGIGRDRLAFGMLDMDSPPANSTRLRLNFHDSQKRFYNGKKTTPIDRQELRLLMEIGSPKFSVTTELPWVGYGSGNSSGFGDMSLTTKTVLKEGNRIQLTHLFRTYFSTGNAAEELGRGHVSFDTGVLIRSKLRPQTEIHGELLYGWPVGTTVEVELGPFQVLRWGSGIVHTWYDSDRVAVLRSLELTGWNGGGTHSMMLTPGCRFVLDNNGDFGLFDAGIGLSLPVSSDRDYASALALEFRWTN